MRAYHGDVTGPLDAMPLPPDLLSLAVNCCYFECPEYPTISFDHWVSNVPRLRQLLIKSNEYARLENFQDGIISLPELEKLYLDFVPHIHCGLRCDPEPWKTRPLDMSSLNELKSVGLSVDYIHCSHVILPTSVTTLFHARSSPDINYKDLCNLKQVLLPNISSNLTWIDLPWKSVEFVAFSAGYWETDEELYAAYLQRMQTPLPKTDTPLKVSAQIEYHSSVLDGGDKYEELYDFELFMKSFFTFVGQRVTELEIWCHPDRPQAPLMTVLQKACPFATISFVHGDDEEFEETMKEEMDAFFVAVDDD